MEKGSIDHSRKPGKFAKQNKRRPKRINVTGSQRVTALSAGHDPVASLDHLEILVRPRSQWLTSPWDPRFITHHSGLSPYFSEESVIPWKDETPNARMCNHRSQRREFLFSKLSFWGHGFAGISPISTPCKSVRIPIHFFVAATGCNVSLWGGAILPFDLSKQANPGWSK